MTPKLPAIGADLMAMRDLARQIHRQLPLNVVGMTKLRQSRNGYYFEALLPGGRVARISVELDRVDPSVTLDP